MGYASLVKPRYTQLPNHVSTSKRGDVIVRTGTGPVGMCLNTLTSVLGAYCTLWLSPKGNCAPTLPIRTLSAPFGGREHVRSAERSYGTRKAPIRQLWVMHRRILGLSV